MHRYICKFSLRKLCVFFLPFLLIVAPTFAQDDWEAIKDHGPHAGHVKMEPDRSAGIEVLPQAANEEQGTRYDVYVLAGNYGPLAADDIKVTIRHKEATKNKDEPCNSKEYYFSCSLSSPPNNGELFFSVSSPSLKLQKTFFFKLPFEG